MRTLLFSSFILLMLSCSEEEETNLHILESCNVVELQTVSGTVYDFYTGEPVPDARIFMFDFTPENEGVVVENTNALGKFEFEANLCSGEQEFFNRYEVTHEDFDASYTVGPESNTEKDIKLYREINLKVNLNEVDVTQVADVSLQFSYSFNDEHVLGKAVGTKSTCTGRKTYKLPKGVDIKFYYKIDDERSETQVLNFTEDSEIDIYYQ